MSPKGFRNILDIHRNISEHQNNSHFISKQVTMETKKNPNEEPVTFLPMLLLGVLAVAIIALGLKLFGAF
jgi:hypothetical protein